MLLLVRMAPRSNGRRLLRARTPLLIFPRGTNPRRPPYHPSAGLGAYCESYDSLWCGDTGENSFFSTRRVPDVITH